MKSLLRTVTAVGLLGAIFACRTAVVGAGESGDHGAITWVKSLDKARALAKQQNKVVMIDFGADWCTPCKQMLATTYKDKEVVQSAKTFVPVQIDADSESAVARKYKVDALPTVIFLDAKGKVLVRSTGYQDKADFLKLMDGALKKANP
jgi:Thiol:disulfide interchange protein